MLRTALLITGLAGLLATAAEAAPTMQHATDWRGWGFRHRRPAQGDFVPVYATYPYHSRERHGLFGYLAFCTRATPPPGTWVKPSGQPTTQRARAHARTPRGGFRLSCYPKSIAELTPYFWP
jgi:hypothetical protein